MDLTLEDDFSIKIRASCQVTSNFTDVASTRYSQSTVKVRKFLLAKLIITTL